MPQIVTISGYPRRDQVVPRSVILLIAAEQEIPVIVEELVVVHWTVEQAVLVIGILMAITKYVGMLDEKMKARKVSMIPF